MSLLCTSQTLHSATLSSLYRNVTVPHSRIFRKFLSQVAANPALGEIVRPTIDALAASGTPYVGVL